MFRNRNMKLVAAGVVLAGLSASTWSQNFPNKPIRIVSPFPAGLGPDVAMRIVAEQISKAWDQPVSIDNRPGANGFIAINEAKKSPTDGYVLLQAGQAQLVINPRLFKKAGYDAQEDFIPISTIFSAPFFIGVSANGPYRDLRELIAAAKSSPGKLSYSSPYVGSPGHLGTELLLRLIGTQMLHVPFKEAAQVYTSVVNGVVDWSMGSVSSMLPLTRGGRLKMIAIAAKSRLASQPDIPTVAEAGGPAGYEVDVWGAVVAPRGTPREVIARLNAGVVAALSQPQVQAQFRQIGLEPTPGSPEAMAARVRAELETYGDIIARANISVD